MPFWWPSQVLKVSLRSLHSGFSLLQRCVSSSLSESRSVASDSVRPHGLQPTRLPCPWASPGKNTGVGCHALLQRIFPTQGSNLGLRVACDSLPSEPYLCLVLSSVSAAVHQVSPHTCAVRPLAKVLWVSHVDSGVPFSDLCPPWSLSSHLQLHPQLWTNGDLFSSAQPDYFPELAFNSC